MSYQRSTIIRWCHRAAIAVLATALAVTLDGMRVPGLWLVGLYSGGDQRIFGERRNSDGVPSCRTPEPLAGLGR